MASWSGFFNLPDKIWFWWIREALFSYVIWAACSAGLPIAGALAEASA